MLFASPKDLRHFHDCDGMPRMVSAATASNLFLIQPNLPHHRHLKQAFFQGKFVLDSRSLASTAIIGGTKCGNMQKK
jgi:hypothetical protein